MTGFSRRILQFVLAFGVAMPGAALAQTPPGAIHFDDLDPAEQIRVLREAYVLLSPLQLAAHPGVPSGFAAPRGSLFFGVAGSTRSQESDATTPDGSLYAGVGLPTWHPSLSAHAVINITSASSEDFGDSGSFAFKVAHRTAFETGVLGLGLGVSGLAGWGDAARTDPAASLTGTWATHILRDGAHAVPLLTSFGIGTDVTDDEKFGAFGALGFGVMPNLSASLGYNGRESVIGLTAQVPELPALGLSLGVNGALEDSRDRRAILSISYTFNDLF